MADTNTQRPQHHLKEACKAREKWLGIAKAIAYELRPFTLPTREELSSFADAVKTNALQVKAEGERLVPEAWKLLKSLEPVKTAAVCGWLCGWAGFIWLEFGAVYFIVSAMGMIFANLGEREEGEWSAYSVFNAGCKALLGTINAEQFEREIMRQNPAAPHHNHDDMDDGEDIPQLDNVAEDRDYVFVDEPVDNDDADVQNQDDYESDGDDAGRGGGATGFARDGPGTGGGTGGRKRVSGKRSRRGFEQRKERQQERRLALEAIGQDQWDEF